MSIVGNPDAVVGGVDTHADVHVAAAVNHVGGVLGIESFETNRVGYRLLVSWRRGFGELVLVGVEGTGSYGVGLARYLSHAGVDVVEVDRPNRQTRHRKGKSDPVDAVREPRCRARPPACPSRGTATWKQSGCWGSLAAPRWTPASRR